MPAEGLTIEHLERWVLTGAHWQVVEIANQRAVVDFCTCTGEPVERLQSNDPNVIAYLGDVRSDLDLSGDQPEEILGRARCGNACTSVLGLTRSLLPWPSRSELCSKLATRIVQRLVNRSGRRFQLDRERLG